MSDRAEELRRALPAENAELKAQLNQTLDMVLAPYRATIERVKPYLQHLRICPRFSLSDGARMIPPECTCGLDNLLEAIGNENQSLQTEKPECIWIDWRHEDAYWATGCGLLWSFEADGPAENGVKFCFGCGGKVAIGEQGNE
jgi:hypothetical protein